MSDSDLSYASALGLVELMRTGKLSPTELMTHTIARIEKLDGGINAVIRLDAEGALAAAANAAARIAHGEDLGPLTGLPILVKDAEAVRGFPVSQGSSAFRDNPPSEHDSYHVARLRAAGAIPFGITNMPPMGAGVHTTNDAFGITRNPFDLTASPGGSSGGAGAAIAAGYVALATAGDSGGSTRIPAALCGMVGLKANRGRIPRGPSATIAWPRVNAVGAITRTVRDTALHLDVAAGHHCRDTDSLPAPGLSYQEAVERTLPRLRIAVLRTFGVTSPEPEILAALDRAAEVLRAAGHEVVEDDVALPHADDFVETILLRMKLLSYNRATSQMEAVAGRLGDFEPWFADELTRAQQLTVQDMARYWRGRASQDHWVADRFEQYDVLLTPTVPMHRWPAEGPDIAAAVRDRTIPIAFTALFNDTGNPAISVPAGLAADGLPLAVHVVGRHHREDLILAVAARLEEASSALRPPLPA